MDDTRAADLLAAVIVLARKDAAAGDAGARAFIAELATIATGAKLHRAAPEVNNWPARRAPRAPAPALAGD